MSNVYVSESNIIVTSDNLSDLAYELRKLGSGVSRDVYALGDGTVLKVDRNPNGSFAGSNQTEWDNWQRIVGTEWEEHFAKCVAIADDGSWLIQEAVSASCEDSGEDWSTWYREIGREIHENLNIGDLHPGNVGTTVSGKFKIIDYAYSYGPDCDWLADATPNCTCCRSLTTPEPCECGHCDCEDCFPNGCECEPFQGCNVVTCAPCWDVPNPNARKYNEAKALVLSVPVCSRHYVKRACWDLNQRNWEREQEGQQTLFVRFLGKEVPARQ